ncbi:MAG: hypothetical protein ABIG28_02560 [archaeon]
MKTSVSKTEAKKKIDDFFKQGEFSAREIKKMKRLAMKFNIKLGEKRRLFCKRCLSKLRGETGVSKTHKIVKCGKCGFLSRHKI